MTPPPSSPQAVPSDEVKKCVARIMCTPGQSSGFLLSFDEACASVMVLLTAERQKCAEAEGREKWLREALRRHRSEKGYKCDYVDAALSPSPQPEPEKKA